MFGKLLCLGILESSFPEVSCLWGLWGHVGACEVMYREDVCTLVSSSKCLFSSLLASATSRFKKTRDERLRSVERSLVSVHDDLKSAMSAKLKAAISTLLSASVADLANGSGDDNSHCTWSHLRQLDKMVKMMKVPLEEAKCDKIMDAKLFVALNMWWKQCLADVVTMSAVMTAVPRDAKGAVNLEEPALVTFLSWDTLPASLSVDDAAAWDAFRTAMLQQVQQSAGRKLTENFPRELTPLAEQTLKATSVGMWEDMLAKAGPLAASVTQESMGSLRSMVDAVLTIRRYLANDWAVRIDKKAGTTAKPTTTTITISVDAVMTVIVVVAFRKESRGFLELAEGFNAWEKKCEIEERVQVMKDFLKATELVGCLRQTTLPAVLEFASKFDGDSPTALARNINSFCHEVCKVLTNQAFAVVAKNFNSVIRMAKKKIGQCLGEFSKPGNRNILDELEKMSEEGKMLDDPTLKDFVGIGTQDFAKSLYQNFRLWNENIAAAHVKMKEHAEQFFVVETWDEDDVVRRAGKVAGSMTLMQGLTAPADSRVVILKKAIAGLAMLGRGLMEGHSVVLARVNHCLAAAAAESKTASDAAALAAAGPPAKKAKTAKGPK